jgi:predicted transcriptional regulator
MNKDQLIALLRDATNTSELLTRLEDLSMLQQLGDGTLKRAVAAYGRSDEIDF